MIDGQIHIKVTITELSDIYKRLEKPNGYIFIAGYIKETGTYIYKDFQDFNDLFDDRPLLDCKWEYINKNFELTTFLQVQNELN